MRFSSSVSATPWIAAVTEVFAPAAEQISLLHQFRRVPLRFPFLGFCASHRRLAVVYDIIAFELLHGAVFIDAELFSVAEYEFHAFAPFFFFII